MLWKLSLTGIKSRLRDYIVLFSGLVMASAIFYMFESMASNTDFLNNNSTLAMTVFIFRFGSVLLGIITFVYILYANSFLMTMRQKDYAMFMMLGAKGRKIAQMIFSETFVVGISRYFGWFSCRYWFNKHCPSIISCSVRYQYFSFYTFQYSWVIDYFCFSIFIFISSVLLMLFRLSKNRF